MRVLQINSVCGVGSTGRIATDIDALLKSKGYESFIAFGRGSAFNCDTSIKIGDKFDNYAHVVKTRVLDKHGLGSKRATNEFINRIIELDPNIIHLHNIHGYYINIEILFEYLSRANKPVIWTLHDCWSFTGHCSHFDFVKCDRWKKGCYSCPQKFSYPSSILNDNSNKNFDLKKRIFSGINNLTIITPSKWLSNLVMESFLNKYPIKVLNNGIDLKVFRPMKSDFRKIYGLEKKFIILGVANVWSERKGYDYLIALAKKLKKDEVIVMVGLTKRQMKNLPENVIGISKTNDITELAEVYSSADVFLNPTLEDNFPTTNLEAIACGTPVITYNTGGSVESVNKDCGLIVEQGSLDGLVDAVNVIKEKGKAFFTERCIEYASNHFDKEKLFNLYIEYYLSMKNE